MTPLLKVVILSALAAAANAQAFNWTLEAPTALPGNRERTATGTDGALYYMYGGQNGSSVAGLDELWSYDGTTWSTLSATGASAGTRAGAVGAFDTTRNKFVVFGGKESFASGAPLLNDTWEWDATNGWVQASPSTNPDRRWLVHNGVDVPGLGVMFHGGVAWDSGGSTYRSNETWWFNGTDWIVVSNGGPRGQNMMMVHRPAHNDLILHGGQYYDAANTSLGTLGETWKFDLGTFSWTQLTTATMPVNSANIAEGLFAAMAYYNPITDKVIVHGGNGGSGNNTTWEFDGTDWADVSTNGASCRNGGMHWIDALGKGVYGPCNEFNGTQNRTRSHGPQSWGSVTITGTDCPVLSSGLTAGLSSPGMPSIGANLDINLTNLTATNLPLVLVGTTTTPPLPMGVIFPGSGATCSLQMTPISITPGATWTLAIPSDPALVSQTLVAQGVQLDVNFTAANTQLAEILLGEL